MVTVSYTINNRQPRDRKGVYLRLRDCTGTQNAEYNYTYIICYSAGASMFTLANLAKIQNQIDDGVVNMLNLEVSTSSASK